MSKKIITGVKPTGSSMHLGNLMGAVLPFQNLAQGNNAAIFIADLHALTSVKNGNTMRDQSFELAVEYFSIFGIDSPITIFRQSDIVDITKLMWILSNVTPYSLMLRAHSFRELQQEIDILYESYYYWKAQKNSFDAELLNSGIQDSATKMFQDRSSEMGQIVDMFHDEINKTQEKLDEISRNIENTKAEGYGKTNMGVFNYPILMAADIIGYDIDAVPVGKDQIQHLEMTRDIARAFNKTYGREVFTEPQAIVTEGLATLPGIDGRKMSKSYDNFIGVFDDEKMMKKRVMSIVSGSEGIDERKKNPDECNIFNLYKVFATPEQTALMRVKYESENIGFGYGHAKTALLEVLMEYLRPYRESRAKLLEHPELVEAKLAEGAKIMNARLEAKMKVVREVVGIK